MKKIYHLSNCKTCQKIIAGLRLDDTWELINIKEQNISAEDLDYVAKKIRSYEDIFSRRAMKFRSMGLHEQTLSEQDYRRLMLEEYTFLKRPFVLVDDKVFVGNTKAAIEGAQAYING